LASNASLISQTVATNTTELPGAFFSQTWTLKNTGTTTWTSGASGYKLALVGSDSLGVSSPTADGVSGYYHPAAIINGGGTVAANATATFTMSCIAPETPGTYTDTFQMITATGASFGPQVTVQIVVSQAGPAGAYDRARAVSYANNNAGYVVTDGYYWDGPNVSDITYYGAGQPVPNLTGDDCAHFVSSCIGGPPNGLGGGLTIASRVPPTYGEPGANHLVETTLLGGGLATQVSSLSGLQPGDVIGWMWSPSDGTIDHVTIYLGNGQLASHANSCLAVSATTWYQSSSPHLTQYLIHINSPTTRYITLSGSLAFGNQNTGSSTQKTLTIYNGGNSALTVNSISLPSGFSGNWSGTIPSAGSQNVTVTFSPTVATTYGGTVTVNTNDTAGTSTMSASGTGVNTNTGTTTAVAVSGGTPTYGQSVTFTATVTPTSGSGETGTVQFKVDGSNFGSPISLGGNTATCTTTALPAGSHSVVAVYSGDGQFNGSTSSTATQAVGKATLTITANSAGKSYGTDVTFSGTAFTQTGLVTAYGDSITGVSETSTGRWAAAAVGNYSIVPSAATGSGLANYNISYVNGSLTITQATDLAVTSGGLVVTSPDNLTDGCNLAIGSFPASAPIVPAASATVASAPASAPATNPQDYESSLAIPDPIPSGSASAGTVAPLARTVLLPASWTEAFGSDQQQALNASAIAALDAVLAEYARKS
jgi:hypothetical protein